MAPAADDLSAFLIAERVASSLPTDIGHETAVRTPAQGIADGVEAERLGFRRVFLSERWNLKEAAGLHDYVNIARRPWRGETVNYNGPAGRHDDIRLGNTADGVPPHMWFGTFGLPVAGRTAAATFDWVLLPPMLTPAATRAAVTRLRTACADIGRDPATLRICQCVVTTPGLDAEETRALAHARAVTYLQAGGVRQRAAPGQRLGPGAGAGTARPPALCEQQGDDRHCVPSHSVAGARSAGTRRVVAASCSLGSVDECIATLAEFRDADEIATYRSTPGQHAALVAAWRARGRVAGASQ